MIEAVVAVLCFIAVVMLALVLHRGAAHAREIRELSMRLADALETKHRGMLLDLHSGLTQQGDRLGGHLTESSERLRGAVGDELKQTRDTLHAMKLALTENMHE